MKQNYKIYLAALLLAGAVGMMTARAQGSGKPKLAVFVVGMASNTDGDNLATQIGAELNRNSRYDVLSGATDPVKSKLTELRAQGAGNIDRNALAEWGRTNGVSTICLVTDAIKGNDHMFYALLIDAKDSKVNGRGSYIRTGVATADLPRVSLALAKQLEGPRRVARVDATPQRKWFEPEMVLVEGGTTTLGWHPEIDADRTDNRYSTSGVNNNIADQYTATVTSFKIGKYEITQEQWRAVMAGTRFENYFYYGGSRGIPNGALNSANCGSVACDDQRPVEFTTWYLALAFCNKLSQMAGLTEAYAIGTDVNLIDKIDDKGDCSGCTVTLNANANGYRIPTQNEWEYAARGCKVGSCERFKYSGSNDLDEVACHSSMTSPVGQRKPNGLGIYDMSGNVWEWCWEILSGSNRIFRGGAWYHGAASGFHRVATRNGTLPNYKSDSMGIRVVLPAQ